MPTEREAPLTLVDAFRHQLVASRLRAGERCVCVTDSAWNPAYAEACVTAARALGAEAACDVLPGGRVLPTSELGSSWHEADLLVYATSHRLHYRPEIRAALDAGRRVLAAMQPGHVLTRLIADGDVRRRTRAGAALLDVAREIRITSDAGTDLRMDKTGRRALAHYGAADEPGRLDFCTAGMVQAAQLEGTLEGRLVLDRGDCCFHLGRLIAQPVVVVFERGRVTQVDGGEDAVAIRGVLAAGGDDGAWMAGHMAWGTDHRARWWTPAHSDPGAGSAADIEAFYGNVQVEIGSNDDVAFRGRNRSSVHLGLCLRGASLWLDGVQVIDHERFVPEALR